MVIISSKNWMNVLRVVKFRFRKSWSGYKKAPVKKEKLKPRPALIPFWPCSKKGEKFESLVEKYSEDKFSKNTQGTLASFGVGQMVPDFEDAAFGLKNPGDMTEPVRTEFGYHIIRLIKKTPVRPYDSIKTELTRKVEKDGRIEIARRLYTEKIKQKVSFKEDVSALEELIAAIPDTNLRNGSFNASDYKRFNKRIFEMTGVTFSQSDFANYIEQYTKGKIYGQKKVRCAHCTKIIQTKRFTIFRKIN
ncbi:MAG: peptidyl-prolyl cis-trans isomerase [Bacteroidetes bacterium]|nr:peptidyl-prolyl cis-trans isomerase [Bacteroidota bacterium]